MMYFAHSGGYNTGESEGVSHLLRESGITVLFITVVFAAAVYALALYLLKHMQNKPVTVESDSPTTSLTKHSESTKSKRSSHHE